VSWHGVSIWCWAGLGWGFKPSLASLAKPCCLWNNLDTQ
jgi:hypothetical protein